MEAGCLGWLNHMCSEKAAQWYFFFVTNGDLDIALHEMCY